MYTSIRASAHRRRKFAGVGVRFASADLEGGGDDPLLERVTLGATKRTEQQSKQTLHLGNIKNRV
jgi:hypothetical protein